ncbi:MAG: hypothetical protein ACYC6N_26525 [Pirellulaceae bacterium]
MHGHLSEVEFLASVSRFLGLYYFVAALLNGGAVWYWRSRRRVAGERAARRLADANLLAWLLVAVVFLLLALIARSGDPRWVRLLYLPAWWRDAWDQLLGPTVFVGGIAATLVCLYWGRRFFTQPSVAWTGLNLFLFGLGLSLTDPDFAAIVGKPDNVPIVGLIVLLGFFTWLSARQAVLNDQRLAQSMPPREAVDNEKVLVWPDLVYIELICMVALTAVLLVWSILLKAPLEQPANIVQTPNPSKAPWYFLGLQEMLVYFDPWMAGVVIPALIIVGLMAIPYLDVNEKGNGYYTINERKFAYVTFQFGFLVLWISLMLMGTFFRGPNWSFFGFYETWDVHKVEALNNVQLSERFWSDLLGKPLPVAPTGAGGLRKLGYILLREWPGIVLLTTYYLFLPAILARLSARVRALRFRLGRGRYLVMMLLLLTMALLPVKMLCRWLFNLNYLVAIPEYFLNF